MVDSAKAATLLIAARHDGQKMDALPADAEPANLGDAYAIQDAIIEQFGLPIAGWKVALTNDEAMERAGASEPAAGPLFAPYIGANPGVIDRHGGCVAGFECEFAFRLANGLPASGAPYEAADVKGAVESMHPAIEVVGARIANRPALGVRGTVADHAGNFNVVLGHAVPNWEERDLARCAVRHCVDGDEIAASSGANVLGNPLNALAWLANHLAGRGRELEAGHLVITGAATGPLPAPQGSKVTGDFGTLGVVEVRFDGD
jgi:2-keto-4-pentenoate hydratase